MQVGLGIGLDWIIAAGAAIKRIDDDFFIYIPGWDVLYPIDQDSAIKIYTANGVQFTGSVNQEYLEFDKWADLIGDLSVSFIYHKLNLDIQDVYVLGRAGASDNGVYVQSDRIAFRAGSFTADQVNFFLTPKDNTLYEIQRDIINSVVRLYENGELVDTQYIGINTGLCSMRTVNYFGSGGWSSGLLSYLKIKGTHQDETEFDSEYLFTEGIGNKVYDSISGNHLTFKTLSADSLAITGDQVDRKWGLYEIPTGSIYGDGGLNGTRLGIKFQFSDSQSSSPLALGDYFGMRIKKAGAALIQAECYYAPKNTGNSSGVTVLTAITSTAVEGQVYDVELVAADDGSYVDIYLDGALVATQQAPAGSFLRTLYNPPLPLSYSGLQVGYNRNNSGVDGSYIGRPILNVRWNEEVWDFKGTGTTAVGSKGNVINLRSGGSAPVATDIRGLLVGTAPEIQWRTGLDTPFNLLEAPVTSGYNEFFWSSGVDITGGYLEYAGHINLVSTTVTYEFALDGDTTREQQLFRLTDTVKDRWIAITANSTTSAYAEFVISWSVQGLTSVPEQSLAFRDFTPEEGVRYTLVFITNDNGYVESATLNGSVGLADNLSRSRAIGDAQTTSRLLGRNSNLYRTEGYAFRLKVGNKTWSNSDGWAGWTTGGTYEIRKIYEQPLGSGLDLYGYPILEFNTLDEFNQNTGITLNVPVADYDDEWIRTSVYYEGSPSANSRVFNIGGTGNIKGVTVYANTGGGFGVTFRDGSSVITGAGIGSPVEAGQYFYIEVFTGDFNLDTGTARFIINGVEYSHTGYANSSPDGSYLIGNKSGFAQGWVGLIFDFEFLGEHYSTINNWQGLEKTGTFGLRKIYEPLVLDSVLDPGAPDQGYNWYEWSNASAYYQLLTPLNFGTGDFDVTVLASTDASNYQSFIGDGVDGVACLAQATAGRIFPRDADGNTASSVSTDLFQYGQLVTIRYKRTAGLISTWINGRPDSVDVSLPGEMNLDRLGRNTSGFNFIGAFAYITDGLGNTYRKENTFLSTKVGGDNNFEERLFYTGVNQRGYDVYGNTIVTANEYDYFNGVDTNAFMKGPGAPGDDLTGETVEIAFTMDDPNTTTVIYNNSVISTQRFGISLGGNQIRAAVYDGAYHGIGINPGSIGINLGDYVHVVVTVSNYATEPTMIVNGVVATLTTSGAARSDAENIGGRVSTDYYQGTVFFVKRLGRTLTSQNDWGGTSAREGAFTKTRIFAPYELDEPLLPNLPEQGYNYFDWFNGINSRVDISAQLGTFDLTAYTIKVVFEYTSNLGTLFNIANDDDNGVVFFQNYNTNFNVSIKTGGVYTVYTIPSATFNIGDTLTANISVSSSNVLIGDINGIPFQDVGAASASIQVSKQIGARNNNVFYEGVIFDVEINNILYNTFNNWNGGAKSNLDEQRLIRTGITEVGYDWYGTPFLGYNVYDLFDGTGYVDIGDPIDLTGKYVRGWAIAPNSITDDRLVNISHPNGISGIVVYYREDQNRIAATLKDENSIFEGYGISLTDIGVNPGEVFSFELFVGNYGNTSTFTVNGNTPTTSVTTLQPRTAETAIGGRIGGIQMWHGIIGDIEVDGVIYNTSNNWLDGIKINITQTKLMETGYGTGVDIFNVPIEFPYDYDTTNELTIYPLNTQTALLDFNNYDVFNGVDYRVKLGDQGFLLSPGDITVAKFIYQNDGSNQMVYSNCNSNFERFSIFTSNVNSIGAVVWDGTFYKASEIASNLGINNGDLVTVKSIFNGYDTPPTTIINGVEVTGNTGTVVGQSGNYYIGGNDISTNYFNGVIINITEPDGTQRNTFNSWGANSIKEGTVSKFVLPKAENVRLNLENLQPWSEDFSVSAWTKFQCTATPGLTDTFGGTAAYTITTDGLSSNDGVRTALHPVGVIGNVYRIEVWLKNISVLSTGATAVGYSSIVRVKFRWDTFDLEAMSGDSFDYEVVDNGDGWYRIGFSYIATSTNNQIRIDNDKDTTGYVSELGVFGAQFRSTEASPKYVKTEGSPISIDQLFPLDNQDITQTTINRPKKIDIFNGTGQENHRLQSIVYPRDTSGLVGLDFLGINKNYVQLNSLKILTGDWFVEAIYGRVSTHYFLGNDSSSAFGFFCNSSSFSIRSGNGSSLTINTTISVGDILRIEKDSGGGVFIFKVNGSEVGTQPIGLHTADFQYNVLFKFSSNAFGSPIARYVNTNNEALYTFNEREGLTVTDYIGSNNGTLASDFDDGSPQENRVSFVSGDFVELVSTTFNSDFFIEFKINELTSNAAMVALGGTSYNSHLIYQKSSNYINIKDVSKNEYNFVLTTPYANGNTYKIERVGTTMTAYVNGIDNGSQSVSLLSYEFLNINKRGSTVGTAAFSLDSINLNNQAEYLAENAIGGTWADSIGSNDGTISGAIPEVTYNGGTDWLSYDTYPTRASLFPQWVKSIDGTTWVADNGEDLIGGSSDSIWINRKWKGIPMRGIMGDDVLEVQWTELDEIEITYGGVTNNTGVLSMPLITADAMMIGIETNGAGSLIVYVGTNTIAMEPIGLYRIGFTTAPTEPMVYGNQRQWGKFSFDGYYASPVYYNRQIGLDGFENIRITTLPAIF